MIDEASRYGWLPRMKGVKTMLVIAALLLLLQIAGLAQPARDGKANQLTAGEKADGWKLLFDGKSWTNWTLSTIGKSSWWKIERGWIRCVPRGNSDEGGRLATIESFRDFELQFEWKIGKQGNSGVKYHLQGVWRFRPEDMETGRVAVLPPTLEALQAGTALGFEYQLTDDENAPDALDSPSRSSAALYRIEAPRKPHPVVAATVHSARIKIFGDRFEHWLDGERVAEGDLRSGTIRAVLEKNRAAGLKKFETAKEEQQKYDGLLERVTADALLRMDVDESPIDFQHHRSTVWFRNIKIRRLER